MTQRVVVVYASEFGSTGDVAEAIGAALREAGAAVDVRPVVDVNDLSRYDAAIIGSAIYNGRWLPEAENFVRFHAATLSRIPVAYFCVCATVREDTPENRAAARSFLDPVLAAVPEVKPVDIGVFAGRVETHGLPVPVRLRMRLTTTLRRGDYRDWAAIRAWATQVAPLLIGDAPPEAAAR